MSLAIRQDPLQTLSYVLFELTGEKLYELFHFVARNPYLSRLIRQKYGKKRAGKVNRGREAILASTLPRSQRRPAPVVEEEDDYELPTDAPYIPLEEETTAAAEKAKLETLEAELARLRAEMAQFMSAASANMQAPNASASPASGPRKVVVEYEGEGHVDDMVHTHMAPPAGLSAPPPPPPPPPSNSFSSALMLQASSSSSQASGVPLQAASSSNSVPSNSRPIPNLNASSRPSTSLSDMVKASNRNTLRKVEGERSPGGTVKRAPEERPVNQDDPAAVIAHALRRRFKSVSGSPDAKPSTSRVSTEPGDFD